LKQAGLIDMKNNLYCAVDIGGTKILLLLIDSEGNVLYREKTSTPKPEHPESIVETITEILDRAAGKAGSSAEQPASVGICTAGFVNYKDGVVHQSPNLNWRTPVALGEMTAKALNTPVLIENDANAAVLGEVYFGAAKGFRDVIYITISTGIGGGLFLDGRLYRGNTGFAGEIGHIRPYGKGRPCKCGGYDCLESWVSGSGIYRSAVSLWDENEANKGHITTSWVFEQADKGNVLAQKIIDHAIEFTGKGLGSLVTLFNPSCIVIGGGVAANRDDYLEKVSDMIRNEAIKPSVEITGLEIVPAKLEPEAGIWGMYALMTKRTEG
jgi:glucokinase